MFPSEINISINDKRKLKKVLVDDPADQNLSWHNQKIYSPKI